MFLWEAVPEPLLASRNQQLEEISSQNQLDLFKFDLMSFT